jgi:flagellar biosynthetic protein FlhB
MERPHAPTPRRRDRARAAGRVLTSPAATSALALGAGVAAAAIAITATAGAVVRTTRDQLAHATDDDATARATHAAAALPLDVLALVAPVLAATVAGALLGHAALARGLWLPRREVRGAPSTGAEPATAGQRAVEASLGVVRTLALTAVATAVVIARLPALAALPADGTARATAALAGSAVATVAIAAVALSLLELAWRHHRLTRSLAMTTREWREDARETGGDPQLRRAIRAAQHDDRDALAGARVVLHGDAVTVALGWEPGSLPRVVRRGRALDARRLLTAARAARVPIVADALLAEDLATAGHVAPKHEPAVAALLAATL